MDESGDTGELQDAQSPVQPCLVLGCVAIKQDKLHDLTRDFIDLKRGYAAPTPGTLRLSSVMDEIKGAELRNKVRTGSKRESRRATNFIRDSLRLMEVYEVKVFARIAIKGIGEPVSHTAIYSSYVQALATCYQHLLNRHRARGIMVLDGRTKNQNQMVSHSIFTQKFSNQGDVYSRILEVPTFGCSENHAGIQFADMLCSALLFPMAAHTYCSSTLTNNTHTHQRFAKLRPMFGDTIRPLQYRYREDGRMRGGIVVNDRMGKKSAQVMLS